MKKASRLFVAGAAAALLPLAAAIAQTPTPEPADQPQSVPPTQGQGATFESLDTDSDGRISKTEAEANTTVKEQFASYDLNGDGFIERAEVNNVNKSEPEAPPPQQ
jgi:Ca2+-binding EF-hand superfamily protein